MVDSCGSEDARGKPRSPVHTLTHFIQFPVIGVFTHPQPLECLLKLQHGEGSSHGCQVLPDLLSLSQRSDRNADQYIDDHNVGRDEEPDEDQLDGALEGDHGLGEGVVKLQLAGHHGDHFYQRIYRTLKPAEKRLIS